MVKRKRERDSLVIVWQNDHMMSCTTCDWFDDFVSFVVAAVAGLESDLIGGTVWAFEPRLQERGQVLQHIILEGLACSSYLHERADRVRHSRQRHHSSCDTILSSGGEILTCLIFKKNSSGDRTQAYQSSLICFQLSIEHQLARLMWLKPLTGSIRRITRDFFFLVV